MCLKPFRHTKDEWMSQWSLLVVGVFFAFNGTDVSLAYRFMDIFIAAGNFSTPISQGSSKGSAAEILATIWRKSFLTFPSL